MTHAVLEGSSELLKVHDIGARALLGLQVFSGCDQVRKMATITKARVMNLFMLPLSTNAALESFCNLSLSTEGEQLNTGLSEFTMQLYSSHHYSLVSDIGALRWFLFSKQNYTGDRLPPTWGVLKSHILRANFVACMTYVAPKCNELQSRDSKSR